MLVVHEDRFRGEYLADVLRGADAIVAGPAETASAGMDLLVAAEPSMAMVLSSAMSGSEALVERAAAKGLATILIHPATRPVGEATAPCLASPYAGFQVVDALATLLLSDASHEEQSVRPCPRGH